MSKKKIILLAFILAVGVGGTYVAYNALAWARVAAEKIASDTLGVDVSVGSIDVSLTDKTVRVAGVTIGNPRGYDTPFAVRLGDIVVTADMLSRDALVIQNVSVSNNQIYLEMKGVKSNLAVLSDGIKTVSKKPKAKAQGAGTTSAAPTVTIKTLLIDNSSATVRAPLLNTDATLVLPPIRLTDIGQNNNQAAAVVAQITRAIVTAVLNAAARDGVLQNMAGVGVDKVKDGLKTGTDALKKGLEGLKF